VLRGFVTCLLPCDIIASGHTATNTPDLFRTPKLTVAGPAQYCRGGPGGKRFGCCWLFIYFGIEVRTKTVVADVNGRWRLSPKNQKGRLSPCFSDGNKPKRSSPSLRTSKSEKSGGAEGLNNFIFRGTFPGIWEYDHSFSFQAPPYLLGLLAMIKCSICSCQCDN
jgi:hypothetical protein